MGSLKKTISAAEANRGFSAVLRRVKDGHSYVVTSHGRPVARIIPCSADEHVASRARAALFKRLKVAPVQAIGRWRLEDLYEG